MSKKHAFVRHDIRNAIIEECAKVAEARAARYETSGGYARRDEAEEIAKDIRALAVPSTNRAAPDVE